MTVLARRTIANPETIFDMFGRHSGHANHLVTAAFAGRYGNGGTGNLQEICKELNASPVRATVHGRRCQGQFKCVANFSGDDVPLGPRMEFDCKVRTSRSVVYADHRGPTILIETRKRSAVWNVYCSRFAWAAFRAAAGNRNSMIGLRFGNGPRAFKALLAFLFISAFYVYAFPQANVFYAGVVLLHAAAGIIAGVFLIFQFGRLFKNAGPAGRLGWILFVPGAVIGAALIKTGTPRTEWNLLYAHILLCLIGGTLIVAEKLGSPYPRWPRWAACLLGIVIIGSSAYYLRIRWRGQSRIENPAMPPAEMTGEGDGPNGPFFPSSAQVYGGQKIPSKFFMESDSCKRCHEDIYKQWSSSAHHFSSFNNQWYRKSIEYMQDTVGTKPSKWCGGCHDPAVLYSGLMDTPIKQIVHRPESQAGLGCMMCHSIAHVKSTMGQADFYLEYPELHQLAASENPVVRTLHDFLIKLNPEPHRRVFLKPFMRDQTAEFCSSCHKVHLDVPVNHYRWVRGFNEYDNWQASGVSGQGARSFYYPAKPAQCADCHMPLTKSNDQGNMNGMVHSHRFPGANTALPTTNEDADQL